MQENTPEKQKKRKRKTKEKGGCKRKEKRENLIHTHSPCRRHRLTHTRHISRQTEHKNKKLRDCVCATAENSILLVSWICRVAPVQRLDSLHFQSSTDKYLISRACFLFLPSNSCACVCVHLLLTSRHFYSLPSGKVQRVKNKIENEWKCCLWFVSRSFFFFFPFYYSQSLCIINNKNIKQFTLNRHCADRWRGTEKSLLYNYY